VFWTDQRYFSTANPPRDPRLILACSRERNIV
jgi:hypothetical protein